MSRGRNVPAGRVAPSVRKAQTRVTIAWYVSIVHGLLLLALGIHLLTADEPRWVLGVLCLLGTGVVPALGRATYRGSSFSAFLLLVSVVAPPVAAFLTGRSMGIPLLGVPFIPVYWYLGVKGATGLRGKRTGRKRESRGSGGGSASVERKDQRKGGGGGGPRKKGQGKRGERAGGRGKGRGAPGSGKGGGGR